MKNWIINILISLLAVFGCLAVVVGVRALYSDKEIEHTHTIVTDVAVAATCTETGLTEGSHCSVCGEIIVKQEVIPATGHSYTYEVTKEPTITETGLYTYTCSVCGDSFTKEITVLSHEHEYESEITTAATCTEQGVLTYTCKYCEDSYTEAIAATGHTIAYSVVENRVSATCTNSGSYERVIYCYVCDTEISRRTVTVAATGHSYTCEMTKEATDTETGLYTYTCSVCGDSYTKEIAVIGHEHEYESEVTTAATCTEDGVLTYTCKYCADSYTETIAATGHSAAEAVTENYVAATCTTSGSYDSVVYCSVCASIISRQIVKIAATGHRYSCEITKEATDTETGLYTYTCSVCGYSYTKEIAVIGHEHEYESEITVAATCTDIGVITYTCKYCLNSYSEAIAATGHTLVQVEAKAATCTESGYSAYEYCTVCGYSTCEEIAALGHSYDDGVLADVDEASEYGVYTYTCSTCNDIYTGSLGLEFDYYSDDSYMVTGIGSCDSVNIVIPSYYNGLPVEIVRGVSFYGNTDIKSVYIMDGIVSITMEAFRGCTSLEKVHFPDTLSRIVDMAFRGCTSLTEINIPDSVTYLGTSAFRECTSLVRVTFSSALSTIEMSAFYGCTALESIVIPENITTIERYAFCECSSLTSAVFANTSLWYYDINFEPVYTEYLSSADIADSAIAAAYLTTDYVSYSWFYLEHEHTIAEAVIENYVEPTSDSDGSYDRVVYCSVCGVEISRETITVYDIEIPDGEPSATSCDSNVYIADLEVALAKTAEAINNSIGNGVIPEEFYGFDDGSVAMLFINLSGDTVEVSAENCILLFKSVDLTVAADKYTTFASYYSDEITAAEEAGDDVYALFVSNAAVINQAIAQVYNDIRSGEIEFWYTLEEYIDIVLYYAVEADDSNEYSFDIIEIDPETGEAKTPNIDFSLLYVQSFQPFEVAFTDKDNLVSNGDGNYYAEDTDAYFIPNGSTADYCEAASEDDIESGDLRIFTPTELDVEEILGNFDWDNEACYFALMGVDAAMYLIRVTEDMITDGKLSISVPCTGTGFFFYCEISSGGG